MKVLIFAFLFLLPIQANANEAEVFSRFVSCLDESSMELGSFSDCVQKFPPFCLELSDSSAVAMLDIKGQTDCFLRLEERVRNLMEARLVDSKNTATKTGFALKRLALDYGLERGRLQCDFNSKVTTLGLEQSPENILRQQSFLANCRFVVAITVYWRVFVHDQIP